MLLAEGLTLIFLGILRYDSVLYLASPFRGSIHTNEIKFYKNEVHYCKMISILLKGNFNLQ